MAKSISVETVVLSNGTTSPTISSLNSNPTGSLSAPAGSLCLRTDSVGLYQQQGPGTGTNWAQVTGTTPTQYFDTILSVSLSGSGNVPDWVPGTLGQNTLIRITVTSAPVLTGIKNGVDGIQVTLMNLGSSPASPHFSIANMDSSSGSANQLQVFGTSTPPPQQTQVIQPQAAVTLYYDGTSSVWRTLNFLQ